MYTYATLLVFLVHNMLLHHDVKLEKIRMFFHSHISSWYMLEKSLRLHFNDTSMVCTEYANTFTPMS